MNASTPIHVSAICGSLREGSHTRMALEIALQSAKEVGATIHLINLRDYELSFCNGPTVGSGVGQMRRDVRKSQGIILGTPVYHGGISGVLKNALDLMGDKEFSGRVIGLVGVAGGGTGASVPLASLRNIGRALHAWVIPHEASIANSDEAFTPDGDAVDSLIHARLTKIGRDVARFAFLHHSKQTQEFVRQWETSMENPGSDLW